MPFINTKLNIPLAPDKEAILKQKFGAASALIGKSESWLMLGFEDNCHMYFKGDSRKPMAFVEVRLYGSSGADAYSKMTAELTGILSDELDIDPQQIYVEYIESENWGWAGRNF